MGSYLNPGNFSFRGSLRSKIYIDKSKILKKINAKNQISNKKKRLVYITILM